MSALLWAVLWAVLLGACAGALPDEALLREEPASALAERAQRLEARVARAPEDDEVLRLLSLVERRLGRGEAALQHAREAVRAAPFVARNHLLLGEAFEARGRPVRALAAYSQAIALDADLLPAYLRHARVQARLRDREAALATLNEAIRREPGHYGARLLQARLHLESDHFERAVQAVEEARVLRPDDPEGQLLHVTILRSAGRVEAAMRLAEAGLRERPEERAMLTALLHIHRERGQWDAARRLLERLERAGPLPAPERLLRVEVLAGQGLESQARTALEALVRDQPGYAPARVRSAERLIREGQPDEGLSEAEQAVAVAPEFAEAHYWSAVAHYQLGEATLGDAALETARRLEPGALAVSLLRIVRLLASYRLDAAAPLLEPLLAEDAPERPPVLLLRAEQAVLEGDRALAEQVLGRIPPAFAPPHVAFARLRLAYLERRWEDVVTQADPLLEHPLLGWRAAYLRASALLRQGRSADVLSTAQPYVEGPRRRLVFHHLVGYAHLLQGNRVAAQRAFLAGLALAPGHPLMIEGLSRMAMDAEDWERALTLLQRGLEAPDGYRRLFLERLIQIAQRRNDVQMNREALNRYLEASDPARAGRPPEPASSVLYGAYVPDYELVRLP